MLQESAVKKILTFLIASVWLINGLFCKLLDLVPRHQQIVARILGPAYAHEMTLLIGVAEVLMCAWVLSSIKPRICSITQIVAIAAMNIIEFILASDLLLFGKINILFAALLILVIFINGIMLKNDPPENPR